MAGFTMIELITVTLVAAVLLTLGVPSLVDFMAEQRVRAATSDLTSDIAFARSNAIQSSRRVYIRKTSTDWQLGWQIFVDLNGNGDVDPGETIKVFNGYGGNMKVCPNSHDFDTEIILRPDGRIVRTSAPGNNDGMYVYDDMADGNVTNNKVRGVLFGLSGRTTTVTENGTLPPCAGS